MTIAVEYINIPGNSTIRADENVLKTSYRRIVVYIRLSTNFQVGAFVD